jgi:hypothetical protein
MIWGEPPDPTDQSTPHPPTHTHNTIDQVTNPPIDPLREGTVMSLKVSLGHKGNVLEPTEEKARLLRLESPILNSAELDTIMGALDLRVLFLRCWKRPCGWSRPVRRSSVCHRSNNAPPPPTHTHIPTHPIIPNPQI